MLSGTLLQPLPVPPRAIDGGYSYSAHFTGAQQPTNNVSWYEAAQFCNYLTSGDKSKGAYQFSGNNTNPGDFLGINRDAAISSYGIAYVIPTEDEWYKAAYHKNDGVTGNYWLYPTQSNNVPSNDLINPDPGNNANFYQDNCTIGSPDWLTAVGEFENSDSAYGTFDQGGNVWEWNETLFGSVRGLRGGAYNGDSSTSRRPPGAPPPGRREQHSGSGLPPSRTRHAFTARSWCGDDEKKMLRLLFSPDSFCSIAFSHCSKFLTALYRRICSIISLQTSRFSGLR